MKTEQKFNCIGLGLYEKKGVLYRKDGADFEPMPICLHDGDGDGLVSSESASGMGWEVDEYSDAVALPSECFLSELENVGVGWKDFQDKLTRAQINLIMEHFSSELAKNDKETVAYLETLKY